MQGTQYRRVSKELKRDIRDIRERFPIFTACYVAVFLVTLFMSWWMLGFWGVLIFLAAFIISLLYEYK